MLERLVGEGVGSLPLIPNNISSLHVVRLPTNKWEPMHVSELHSVKGACQQAAEVLLAAVLFVRL